MLIQIGTSGRFYHYLLVDTMADTAVFLYQLFNSLLQLLADDDDVEKQSHSIFTLIDGIRECLALIPSPRHHQLHALCSICDRQVEWSKL